LEARVEIIERYVYEVAMNLPADSDVPEELHSLLLDKVEQRAAELGKTPDDAIAIAVLGELGRPEEVALRYSAPRSLIGPAWYPEFEAWAASLVVIPAVALVLGRAVAFFVHGDGIGTSELAQLAWGYLRNTFVLLGCAVLVFAVLERMDGNGEVDTTTCEWDPRELLG
jgi:hypothetical protein